MKITREIYDRLHATCPKCGTDTMEATQVSYIIEDMTSQDKNEVWCVEACDFKGTVHDLAPRLKDIPLQKLLEAMERSRLLSAGDIKSLSPAAVAAITLTEEITFITGLLMGYASGDHKDTQPIFDYLLYRGLLIKDEGGIRIA